MGICFTHAMNDHNRMMTALLSKWVGKQKVVSSNPNLWTVTAQLAWKLHPLCDESMVRANGGRDIVLSRRQGNGESGQANAGTDVGEVLGSICLTASSRWIPRGNGSFVAAALTLVAVVMSPKQ